MIYMLVFGAIPTAKDKQGRYFIDRDGTVGFCFSLSHFQRVTTTSSLNTCTVTGVSSCVELYAIGSTLIANEL
jgi:hypothetical protein